ncbi:hypothetical protein [Tissierella pigra]|uniref:hypothetical protein n=1 Tax=Tissierella pigra TaxID=2607614 RepID=UPI0012B3C70C|nr:hypothetical protein [Tissierella pigra]
MKNPCYKCSNREIGCHSNCNWYLAFKEKSLELSNNKKSDNEYGDYLYHAVKRMKGVRV